MRLRVALTGLLFTLVSPVLAVCADRPPRLGVVLGASALSVEEQADRGRSSSSASVGPSLLIGSTLELPIWNDDSDLGFEVAYGPYRKDSTDFCVTSDFPTITRRCFTERATAGALATGLQFTHRFFGARTVRPWLAAGTGLRLTWFKGIDSDEELATSQTFHVGAGAAARRARLEVRLVRVLHHPHPGPSNDAGDARTELQVRVTVFPFGPGR